MTDVEQLHTQAMDLAEEAFAAQRHGDTLASKPLLLQAFTLEVQAVFTFMATDGSEPTRSILCRSAASLAYHLKDYAFAQSLIAFGLRGTPPPEITEELRTLQADILQQQQQLRYS